MCVAIKTNNLEQIFDDLENLGKCSKYVKQKGYIKKPSVVHWIDMLIF